MGPPSDAKGSGGSGSSKASAGGADYQHWIPGFVCGLVCVCVYVLSAVFLAYACPFSTYTTRAHSGGKSGSGGAPPKLIDEDDALLLKGEQPEQPQQKHGGFPSPEQPQVGGF